MDRDNIKGKLKDIGGRIQRQAGEWTGNEDLQEEGARNQVAGKVQNAWGNVKDTARDLKDEIVGPDADRDVTDSDRPKRRDVA